MIDKTRFLEKYVISEESFIKSQCNWEELVAIYNDFISKKDALLVAGNLILERLRLIHEIHSLKIRIKDSEHLIEKIIRKKEENPARQITLETYSTEVTDLIGVRALHLFKDEWIVIHHAIKEIWELHETPIAYIRTGDPDQCFKDNGCDIKSHKAGYRSVHYLVKSQPTKMLHIAEIQVRTIFEEGWSEIDHRLRYPYDINNELLNEYLQIFNRLAGSADEMGSYIKLLKSALTAREKKYEEQRDQFLKEKEIILNEMEKLKGKLTSETKEKEELQLIIDSLKKTRVPELGLGIAGYVNALSSGGAIGGLSSLGALSSSGAIAAALSSGGVLGGLSSLGALSSGGAIAAALSSSGALGGLSSLGALSERKGAIPKLGALSGKGKPSVVGAITSGSTFSDDEPDDKKD